MIDPACGSGHFLLGAFRRILDRWQREEPGTNVRELVQRTLHSVHGVDLNPFAIAIARFRLLLEAMLACHVTRLVDAPGFQMNLVCGDSLLHAPLKSGQMVLDYELTSDDDECDHAYQTEDLPALKQMLRGNQYHAVVANPPYIVPRDRGLNERYRKRYKSCHMKYSLAVPFLERIFKLGTNGGYNGQITANSFMKREFGKKLIEAFFPTVDLTHVIDSQLAHIPGHGTPTVILMGRNRAPMASRIRLVGAIKREDNEPTDAAKGLVWSAIVAQIDHADSKSEFVSVSDSPIEMFHKHPWSIGGGGAAELKEQLEDASKSALETVTTHVGIVAVNGEQELYCLPVQAHRRFQIEKHLPLVVGDEIRDWSVADSEHGPWFYNDDLRLRPLEELPKTAKLFWPFRSSISQRRRFGRPMLEQGLTWYEWQELYTDKLRTPLSIGYSEISTHNHFVLDRGGKVFNRTAPVIKLPPDASEDDHLTLLALLNSSVGGFWMKQVCHCKGGGGIGGGIAAESWERFYAFNGTKLYQFPIPLPDGCGSGSEGGTCEQESRPSGSGLLRFSERLDELARKRPLHLPAKVLTSGAATQSAFAVGRAVADKALAEMIALQEELDWECYWRYGLIDEDLTTPPSRDREGAGISPLAKNDDSSEDHSLTVGAPGLALGQRAFEIVLARKMAAGEMQTTWFERHGSTPITELPAEWPDDYCQLVERRIALIKKDPNIRLIEQPEYKRRWNTESWDSQLERAFREWLLDRLESYFDFDGRMKESEVVASSRARQEADSEADPGSEAADTKPALLDDQWQGACREISKAETEPQTYFVTFTCYGTWLHGDERGSIDREHNEWQTPPLEPDEERERREFALLKHSPVKLGPQQRLIVHRTIEEVCQHRGWRLHALNVRTNHVHVVVTANRLGKRVYNDFKSYATRRMKEAGCVPEACLEVLGKDRFLTGAAPDEIAESSRDRQGAESSEADPKFKVWTRGGSARPIDTENSFRRAIEYTLHEQGPDITHAVSSENGERE